MSQYGKGTERREPRGSQAERSRGVKVDNRAQTEAVPQQMQGSRREIWKWMELLLIVEETHWMQSSIARRGLLREGRYVLRGIM